MWVIRLKRGVGGEGGGGEQVTENNTCSAQCLQCMFELCEGWRPVSLQTTLASYNSRGGAKHWENFVSCPYHWLLLFTSETPDRGLELPGTRRGRRGGDLWTEGKTWRWLVWDEDAEGRFRWRQVICNGDPSREQLAGEEEEKKERKSSPERHCAKHCFCLNSWILKL